MIEITYHQWKQVVEGLRRGDIGPFTQHNSVDGNDCYREYKDGDTVVACMKVIDSNTDKNGADCDREYMAAQSVRDAVAYIYIPSDQDIESWSDQELDIDAEIAAREPVA